MFDRVTYKENARLVYKGNVWLCILATGIVSFINSTFGGSNTGVNVHTDVNNGVTFSSNIVGIPVINELTQVGLTLSTMLLASLTVVISIGISIFVINMLQIGKAKFFIDARQGNYDVNNLIFAYKNGYLQNSVIAMLVKELKIAIYTIFLIVPGIMKAYELRYVNYLLAEDPTLTWQEAHELSSQMTYGHKMDLYVMDLSFFGWYLFDAFTFGVGQVFTAPYYEATNAEAFEALKYLYRESSYDRFEV